MKYQIITSSIEATAYEVEAKSEKEAKQKFWNGEWTGGFAVPDYDLDAQEEVIEVISDKDLFFEERD